MSNLSDQLKALEKSAKFQKKVMAAQKNAAKMGIPFGQGNNAISRESVMEKCRRMKELLYDETVKVIASIELEDIEIGPIKVDNDGNYVANIGFNRAAAHRDSLYSEKYDGIDNIFVHLTHGWDAKDYVYGSWHGDSVRSKLHADGNEFIERAVSRFNEEMKGTAQVDIDPMYL